MVKKGAVMTTSAIVPKFPSSPGTTYRAVAGQRHSVGRTPGEALDTLTAHLSNQESGTLIVVQHMRPDAFFTAAQRERLAELRERWRKAPDAQTALPPAEQAELDALIAADVEAATVRAAAWLPEPQA
jgi:hypothetical protein